MRLPDGDISHLVPVDVDEVRSGAPAAAADRSGCEDAESSRRAAPAIKVARGVEGGERVPARGELDDRADGPAGKVVYRCWRGGICAVWGWPTSAACSVSLLLVLEGS